MSNPLSKDREQEIRATREVVRRTFGERSSTGRAIDDLLAEIDRLRAALDELRCAECGEKVWISPEDGQLHIASINAAHAKLVKAIEFLEELDAYGMPEHIAEAIRQTLKELHTK